MISSFNVISPLALISADVFNDNKTMRNYLKIYVTFDSFDTNANLITQNVRYDCGNEIKLLNRIFSCFRFSQKAFGSYINSNYSRHVSTAYRSSGYRKQKKA